MKRAKKSIAMATLSVWPVMRMVAKIPEATP
jgi:hypothetical protein